MQVHIISEDGELDAPCGCYACNEQVQPDHFACELSPLALLAWERNGYAYRQHDDGRWRWFVTEESQLRGVIAMDPDRVENLSRSLQRDGALLR